MPELLDAVRRESETDRAVMEKGTRAFVSFVRGYKEHHCKFIFRLAGACGASGSKPLETAVACLLPSRCCIADPWLYIARGRQRQRMVIESRLQRRSPTTAAPPAAAPAAPVFAALTRHKPPLAAQIWTWGGWRWRWGCCGCRAWRRSSTPLWRCDTSPRRLLTPTQSRCTQHSPSTASLKSALGAPSC